MNRRSFLRAAAGGGAASLLGPAAWIRVLADPPHPGVGPYGPLQAPDGRGLRLPAGFRSRVIARSLLPVAGTLYVWPVFPDGAGTFATSDGGWILTVNSENPPPAVDVPIVVPPALKPGGASAIRFAADGRIVNAYRILSNTMSNCAGGVTPWGTWLSCEEFDGGAGPPGVAGRVWECDPRGINPARVLPGLGQFAHEAAAIDPVRKQVYLTEDQPDGRFYRFTPTVWPNLANGVLEAARRAGSGAVTWHRISDFKARTLETRYQVPSTTAFKGGEGCYYDNGHVYITTKHDNRVWDLDVVAANMRVLYDAADYASPVLTGVDNVIVSRSGDIFVAEDGGNMELVMITPEGVITPFLQATGPQHGVAVDGLPTTSEICSITFSPNGRRLYFSSERGFGVGITYEVTGPFRA